MTMVCKYVMLPYNGTLFGSNYIENVFMADFGLLSVAESFHNDISERDEIITKCQTPVNHHSSNTHWNGAVVSIIKKAH